MQEAVFLTQSKNDDLLVINLTGTYYNSSRVGAFAEQY